MVVTNLGYYSFWFVFCVRSHKEGVYDASFLLLHKINQLSTTYSNLSYYQKNK